MADRLAVQVSFADDFFARIGSLAPADHKRVIGAVEELRVNSDSQGLRLKPLHGRLKGLMSIRAASDLRVILERRGSTFVMLDAGPRGDVYARAERARLVANPATGFIGFVGPNTEPAPTGVVRPELHDSAETRATRPFDHWSETDLTEVGFGPGATAELLGLHSEDGFFDLALSNEEQELALDIIELTPDQWRQRQAAPSEQAEEHAREDEERLVDLVNRFGALAGLSPFFSDDELCRLVAAPIEEWMLFLHPDQRSVVECRYSGPARIRGSAGTGKTVVLLHRAAELAMRYDPATTEDGGRILVTTYINSLPPVLAQLFCRLPNARPDLVEFTNVDKLAHAVCTRSGERPVLDPRATDAAWATAWKQVATRDSPLRRQGISDSYARQEITSVIKGRGITDVDSYLVMKRTGRRFQLPEAARRQVWALHEAWDEGMARRGVVDFPDVVLRARDLARTRSEPAYRAALVDEAQDLTLVGLQLIRSLVNAGQPDRPDGLFLAGDGAQRIYPGGFTLRQAGVEVRGRTTVLRTNYRNTAEILGVAVATTGSDEIEDLGEDFRRGEDAGDALRDGDRPRLLVARDDDHQHQLVNQEIDAVIAGADGDVGPGDIAVLCPSNKAAKAMRASLSAHHLPTIDLNDYDGTPNESIKVGTLHRVKGLEFKLVIITDLSDGVFPRPRPNHVTAAEWADQEAEMDALLFVAMTRARDRLVLTCVRDPHSVLGAALDHLELVDAAAPTGG